jgi:hypothetical protein
VFSVRYGTVIYNVDENRAGHVAHTEDGRGTYRVLAVIPEGKKPFGRPSLYGMISLKWISKQWDWEA